jgi:type II secretory pathway pseudopilin PulG
VADELPVPSADAGSPPAEPAELSLSDHEKQFSAKNDREAPAADGDAQASGVAPEEAADPSSAGERDEQGRFRGKRAKSHAATPADAPRINELTKRLREREAELESLRRAAPAPAPAPRPATPPQSAPTQAPRLQGFIDQLKPDEDYNLAVERHAEAIANWTWQRREQQQQQQQAERQFAQTFQQKVASAQERYPDFNDVALNAPSAIPQGSLIDRWVWEHRTGADVLYYFQKFPGELPRVLAQSPLDQLETLALISQHLAAPSPSTRSVAAGTGSATAPVMTSQVPRPPNPVRTGPMRGGDEPPGDDAPLSAHEQFYYRTGRRRA